MNEDSDPDLSSDFDPDTHARKYGPEARARALQSLLVEKELLSTDTVNSIIARYEEEIGPLNGARVVARAWTDEAFCERLLEDGTAAMEEMDIDIDTEAMDIDVQPNDDETHNIVVCTLCSCYPWAVLGLPPTWYKTPEYRSRAVRDPRGLLREDFDLDLADQVEIQVWDSTSEQRYMVLPQRPPGTEDMDEDELVETVTRNAMIGTDRLGGGHVAPDGGVAVTTNDRLSVLDMDDRPTFEAPWQARAFAVAVALTSTGRQYSWDAFQHRLVKEIEVTDRRDADPETTYYRQWLRALERFVLGEGFLMPEAVEERVAAFDAGNRDAHEFVEGDPHGHVEGQSHDHGHNHNHEH